MTFFENVGNFFKNVLHVILPNPDWKKIAWAAGLGVASFFLLGFVIPAVLSVKLIAIAGAVAVGYLVYTKVAMWEIERALKAAKDLAAQAGVKL